MKKFLLKLLCSIMVVVAFMGAAPKAVSADLNGITIYIYTGDSYSSAPYLWVWDPNNTSNNFTGGNWPGKQCTLQQTFGSYTYWYMNFPDATVASAIINTGGTTVTQTGDITGLTSTTGAYYYKWSGGKTYDVITDPTNPDNVQEAPKPEGFYIYWDNSAANFVDPTIYYFGGVAGTGDEQMTVENADKNIYKGYVPKNSTIIFKAAASWTGQSGNFTNPQENHLYGGSGSNFTPIDYGVYNSDDIPDTSSVYYLLGANINGKEAWDFSNIMKSNSDGTYTWTGESLGSNFKFTDAPDWDHGNYGTNGKGLELNVPYEYSGVDGVQNIEFADKGLIVKNPTVILNTNNNTVTVSGEVTQIDPSTLNAYIAGDFTSWETQEAYKLTYDDRSWNGTFNIPENALFQVVLGNDWYGSSGGNVNVDITTGAKTLDLLGGFENRYQLNTWTGGNVTFNVSYDDMQVIVTPVPKEPDPIPDNLYIRGSFNDGTNDAEYALPFAGDSMYEGTLSLPAGKQVAFNFYGNEYYSYGAESADQAVTLQSGVENELTIVENGTNNFVLQNYIGGPINFNVNTEESTLSLEWTAPTLYLVGDNVNGAGTWGTENAPGTYSNGVYTWSLSQLGSSFKITDVPSDWSGSYNIGASSNDATLNFGEDFTFQNDGSSTNINFTDNKYHLNSATVTLNLLDGTLKVEGTQELNQITAVYVAGSFNGWTEALEDETNALVYENGIYKGTLVIDEADPSFKVVVKYGNVATWFGAESGKEAIELDGENAVTGLNLVNGENFQLTGFTSGDVTFTVNTDNMTLDVLYLAPDPETITIYAYNNAEWDDMYLYMYQDDQPYDQAWPGIAPTGTEDINGYQFNTYVIEKNENASVSLIFNNNNSTDNKQVEYSEVVTLEGDYYFEVNPTNVALIDDPDLFEPTDNTTAPLKIYLLGDNVNGESTWENPVELTYDEQEGVYTWTGTELGSKFKFNNGSWTDGYNIGAADENNELTVGVEFSLVNDGNAKNILLAENTYIANPVVTLDIENLTLIVNGDVISTAPYVPGETIALKTSLDWEEGFELTLNDEGVYTGSIELPAADENGEDIQFKLDCGENHWYGPVSGEENVELGETAVSLSLNGNTENNWTLTNWEGGVVEVTVDWEAGTMTLSVADDDNNNEGEGGEGEGGNEGEDGPTDGIIGIDAEVLQNAAIYNIHGLRINNVENLQPGIYIINGRKVVVRK